MNGDKQGIGLSAGGLTLLVIFTVLCLTVFGVLSLSAAQADERLTQKSMQLTKEYYDADGRCVEKLKAVTDALRASMDSGDEAAFWDDAGSALGEGFDSDERTYSFTEPINESLVIDVKLKLSYSGQTPYEIIQWRTVSVREEEFDDTMSLWTGD